MLVTDQIRWQISAGGSGGYGPRVLARIRPAKRISAFFHIREIRRGSQADIRRNWRTFHQKWHFWFQSLSEKLRILSYNVLTAAQTTEKEY